jgi:hypothetical protein
MSQVSAKPPRTSGITPAQNYGLAVLSIGIAPWLPIIIEWLIEWVYARPIDVNSLVITLACYSITVALSTNYPFMCFLFLILSGVDSAIYGALLADASHDTFRQGILIAVLSLLGILTFASVARERYVRHVQQHQVFFEWLKS